MSGDGQPDRHVADIDRLENAADEVTRATTFAVQRTFITPFDRSQILELMKDTGRRMFRRTQGIGRALGRGPQHRGRLGDNPAGLHRGRRHLLLARPPGDALRRSQLRPQPAWLVSRWPTM